LFAERLAESGWYADVEGIAFAVSTNDMFNVIDSRSGWKADLVPIRRRAFSEAEFARRVKVDLLGMSTWIASVEDTILAKLEWAARSGSDRQRADVAAMVRLNPNVDRTYLEKWAGERGVGAALGELLEAEGRH
jgi:hypothetical protein